MTIVATLMAGIIDMGYYCMDSEGKVYRFDPREQKAVGLPMSEILARRVREAIARRSSRPQGPADENQAAPVASTS
jgi:hypothetical protein